MDQLDTRLGLDFVTEPEPVALQSVRLYPAVVEAMIRGLDIPHPLKISECLQAVLHLQTVLEFVHLHQTLL